MIDNESAEAIEVEIPKFVTVGDKKVVLGLPKSMALRFEVASYYQKNELRTLAASLAFCWTGVGRPKAKFESSYNLGTYGGEVFDELIGRGVSPSEITNAGSWAFAKIVRSLPQVLEKIHDRNGEVVDQIDEVDRAEGN